MAKGGVMDPKVATPAEGAVTVLTTTPLDAVRRSVNGPVPPDTRTLKVSL